MKTQHKLTIVALSVLALSACSSNPVSDYVEAQQELVEQKNEQMNDAIEKAPEWFLNPPASNGDGVYATAMGRDRKSVV